MKFIKLDYVAYIFIFIYVTILVGATANVATYSAIAISSIWVIMILSKTKGKPNVELCQGCIWLLILQNLAIGVGAQLTGNMSSNLKLLTQIPFLVILLLWVGTMSQSSFRGYTGKSGFSFIFLLCTIVLSLIIGRGELSAILVNVRNMTIFYMAYSIGYSNVESEGDVQILTKTIILGGIIMTLVGILFYLNPLNIYKSIGVDAVYIAKASPNSSGQLPGRFYTTIINKQLLRMASLYYEPVNLGYYMALAFLCALFSRFTESRFIRTLSILITGIGLIFCFGKGGYMIAALSILCVFINKILIPFFSRIPKHLSAIILFLIIGVTVAVLYSYISYTGGAAIWPHIWGIIYTWDSVKMRPWGYGLGLGGNAAFALGNKLPSAFKDSNGVSDWIKSGGETQIFSFMYQIGIQGIIAFFTCIWCIRTNVSRRRATAWEILFNYIPIILFIMAIFQDNTFTPQCIVPFMFLQGGMKKLLDKKYLME